MPVFCPRVNIYVLRDPDSGEVRYVGKTVQKLKNRLASHYCRKRNYKQSNTFNHTEAWIKSLRNLHKKPIIELLESVDNSVWGDKERYYIQYFKNCGFNLTNHSIGGDKSNLGSRWKIKNEDLKYKMSERLSIRCVVTDVNMNLIQEFSSFKEASIFLKVVSASNSCNKNTLVRGKYFVFRKDDLNKDNFIVPTLQRRLNRPVYVYNTDNTLIGIYKNTIEASNSLSVCNSTISRLLKDYNKKNNKYIFRYE